MLGLQLLPADKVPRHLCFSFPKLFYQAFEACLGYLCKTHVLVCSTSEAESCC